jgi:putative PIN family toxin of toxin-antitoxin system
VKVFLDTNVLVSAVISRGLCRDLLNAVLEEHEVLVSELVLDEFVRVLRGKFGAPQQSVGKALLLLDDVEVLANPGGVLETGALDMNDATILATAVEAHADVFVTGDHNLLSSGETAPIPVISPRHFWEMTHPTQEATPYPDPTNKAPRVSEPKANLVREKCFAFAIEIIKLYKKLEQQREYVISKQVLRSGTSIGALVEESTAAESRRDFLHKLNIASKEARETHYWLRLLQQSDLVKNLDLTTNLQDAEELMRMLTAIVKTTASTPDKNRPRNRG